MATEVAFYVRRAYKNGKTWIHKNIIPAKVTAEPPSFREQIERRGGGKGFLFFFFVIARKEASFIAFKK